MGTWMRVGNDLRYNPTTCLETFPLPWPPGEEPEGDSRIEMIAEAALRLDELKRNWLNPEGASEAELEKRTLSNLHNTRLTWLENAHERLDEAVFVAYGWSLDITDEEVPQNLLALNLDRSNPLQKARHRTTDLLSRIHPCDEGIFGLAQAYRTFVKERPGLYAATVRSYRFSHPDDPELAEAEGQAFEPVLAVLASYGLSGEEAVYAARGLRSVAHGFATLEVAGGFGIALDPEESFVRLLEAFAAGLRDQQR
jgi:hypothetical protein